MRHCHSFLLFKLSILLFSEIVYSDEAEKIKKEQKRERVAPYLKHLTHLEDADLVGGDFFMIFGQSEDVKGDNRAGIGLKLFSTRGWLYQDISLSYLGGYQEVVSPVEPKHIYDGLILVYHTGLDLNVADIVIPYIALGPGITLREDSTVVCKENFNLDRRHYCSDSYGDYETKDVQYYLRPNVSATAGVKIKIRIRIRIRIRGFEFDFNGYALAIPSETYSGVKIGAVFSI